MRKNEGFIKHWSLSFLVCSILNLIKPESAAVKLKRTIGKIVDYLKELFRSEDVLNSLKPVVGRKTWLRIKRFMCKNAKV